MAKRAAKKPKPQSQRYPNVRKEMKIWLDAIVRNYEKSDPGIGTGSEDGKLERARQTIELWWYLYSYLMVWAQSQIVGYQWALKNPETLQRIADKVGIETVTEDSHLLEYIGLIQTYNYVNENDPFRTAVFDELENSDDWALDDETLRLVIRELTVSKSTESSFWRFPLQRGLYALNLGETLEICRPSPVRRQGRALKVLYWKRLAICHVHFLIGQGFKKYRAFENVSMELGQGVETLRDWEKSLRRDEDAAAAFHEAAVAGQFQGPLTKFAPLQKGHFQEDFWEERFRNAPLSVRAWIMLKDLRENSVSVVREGLREDREKPKRVVAKKPVRAPRK